MITVYIGTIIRLFALIIVHLIVFLLFHLNKDTILYDTKRYFLKKKCKMTFEDSIIYINSKGFSAYEIHQKTGLNEAGVRKVLNNKVANIYCYQ